ncbi:hypothetical protein SUGI_0496720 [Cryptomeria japonica]|uniref:senescence/dehydration-associated protein At4g35985, chloroplastic n=1 Tax=Cryptomeria japonica TaxID=3369 RepID=UPI002408AA35|nr:senescence/dehydration-associated protein At4g35985, chloroplastic [Cryptomeria japonica]GLJ25911.1 hypothetical protein SUGI_0496720 [Cryptomeria japonica]
MKGHEEILLTIPGAVVNLVDQDKSQELAKGQFSVVKLFQGDKAIAIYAKVGGDLCWPVTKDAPTLKLDSRHYLFSVHTPPAAEEAGDHSAKSGRSEVLNFGVTFGEEESVGILDQCLKKHACLSLPSGSCSSWCSCLPNWSAAPPNSVKESGDSEAYWTSLAPNVEEYNTVLAKAIAGGSGQIIKGIFVISDGYSSQVRRGGELLRSRSKAGEKPSAQKKKSSEISPRVKKNIRRVRKLSKMTENLSSIVVDGVSVTPLDAMDSHTKSSRNCFKVLPAGDVVLASLDSYNKVLEATHVAGKDAAKTTSEVTTGVIAERYGEDAGEVAEDTLAITGHAIGTAVNVAKVTNPGLMLS